MKAIVQPNQNIMDVAVNQYGHIQGVYWLCKTNGLSYSDIVGPGTELVVENLDSVKNLGEINYEQKTRTTNIYEVIEPGQNIYDLAIAKFGSVEGVFQLCKNNNISFSSTVNPGIELVVNGTVKNKNIVAFFAPLKKIASGSIPTVNTEPLLEGIGYWAIEVDFVVS